MKLKSNLPVRRFFAFLGALYLFCLAAPLLFAAKPAATIKAESVFRIYDAGMTCNETFLRFYPGAAIKNTK